MNITAPKSTSETHTKNGEDLAQVKMKGKEKNRTHTLSPKNKYKEEDEDAWETETKDGFFPEGQTDYQEDMDENYFKGGAYHANHFNHHRLSEKGHVMTGFFKFMGCCGER